MRNAEFHMANIDENIENSVDLDDDISLPNTKLSKKKLLFIVVPIVTVIGFSGFYYSAQKSTSQQSNTNYSIVHNNSDGGTAETITIFYDLPEINVRLKNSSNKEQIAKLQALIFKEGNNACYLPKANKIITPDKSLQTSVFHEIGHALNNNGGIILKTLQKARPISTKVPGLILLISLFNKRKATDKPQKNDSKIQKGADFVKRNAGILTAISFMPMVLEEGIASIRGQKLAKTLVKSKDLSKDIFKKIKITNLYGFTTYSLAAIAGYIGVKLAIKVKDTIQTNYENEQKANLLKKI